MGTFLSSIVKKKYMTPIVDKILSKLSNWKGSCLSMAGRFTLVKSVIHSLFVYSVKYTFWFVSILKKLEAACRNFLWFDSINIWKICIVAWNFFCQPLANMGLGLRSIITLNEAANLKLLWDLINCNER